MQKWRIAILACFLIGGTTAPSSAVIILPKGERAPIAAFLVRQDSTEVVVREPLPDGTFRERTIPRSEIDQLIVTVSSERLERLLPDDPRAYRDYAEELAEKRKDPEARDAAVRLYLIAAYLAPEELGRSCLMGIAALVDEPAEQEKFRAMAYLLDPAHNRELLKQSRAPRLPKETAVRTDSRPLLDALRALRQGKYLLAAKQAESARPLFDRYGQLFSYAEFTKACQTAQQSGLSPHLLRRILGAELALLEPAPLDPGRRPAKAPSSQSWLGIIAAGGHAPVPSLSLETITPFNPHQCCFRDGRWTEP